MQLNCLHGRTSLTLIFLAFVSEKSENSNFLKAGSNSRTNYDVTRRVALIKFIKQQYWWTTSRLGRETMGRGTGVRRLALSGSSLQYNEYTASARRVTCGLLRRRPMPKRARPPWNVYSADCVPCKQLRGAQASCIGAEGEVALTRCCGGPARVVNGTLHGVACCRTCFPSSGSLKKAIQTPEPGQRGSQWRLPSSCASKWSSGWSSCSANCVSR